MGEQQTLNQYQGTDDTGNTSTIVAEDMTTACSVYYTQNETDPLIMQCTKKNILCVLPTSYTTFTTEVYDETGAAATTCTATPTNYTLLAGSKQIFTATVGDGWSFVKWTIDGEEVSTEPVALLTIPASSTTVTIQAVFEVTADE